MSSPGLCVLALLRRLMLAVPAAALGRIAARGLARAHGGPTPAPLPGPRPVRASLLARAASAGLVIEVPGRRSLAAAGPTWGRRRCGRPGLPDTGRVVTAP